MTAAPSIAHRLATPRLVLRATGAADAARGFEIQSDWNVTRMLRMARFPPDRAEIGQWFADHPCQWIAGKAYRFAVEREGSLIGIVDLDEIAEGAADLGYWFDPAAWGQGFAGEAALAVVNFAFAELDLVLLRSAHASDNPASGRVLRKLGFRFIAPVRVHSRSRGEVITQLRYELTRPDES